MNYSSDVGFLLANATQRWNERLLARFRAAGFPEVRASYGSLLLPLFEQDGPRIGEIGRRAWRAGSGRRIAMPSCGG